MHIVIFVHPGFQKSQSMPRYANLLIEGMRNRKHEVEVWTAKSYFYKLPSPAFIKKWLGYLDQFVIFPIQVKLKLLRKDFNTLFVFTDQALGPWMPLVSKRPFVVHCHDFLAQRSALDQIHENRVKLSGKIYQRLIRKGYRKAKYFISISMKTRDDLHLFLGNKNPEISRVVYNGLNQDFKPGNTEIVRQNLSKRFNLDLNQGFILHVGGNQFYKNRKGVLKIYDTWSDYSARELPLLMIGSEPDMELLALREKSSYRSSIHFLTNVSDENLRLAYQGASVFLYPSIAEGFGWPIAEAMASGCPVITTGEPPMNEVGGEFGIYIPKMPQNEEDMESWVRYSANVLNEFIELEPVEKNKLKRSGIQHARRFDRELALEKIEQVYKEVYQLNEV
ncbi:glycosyltransferase family 4 protein [Gramella sp. GC03-9]|uniref:Glycosyltransferase family 4 protein n=1 Tax=Christiangramia oceanisediminis TaxID=2920386 RepID=A0A9X2I557_9FLAO|nr:glycosyltransferase family 1 protein [Gramella oceanisediminis]MCP9199577.1 glycosyltransferase family 4 protein [Gramella oceanisediminis]